MYATQARVMATYNKWMNEKIYDACSQLTDEERKKDRDAFFKSIHGTLNHILLGDKIWMSRFKNSAFSAKSLDQELFTDFEELRSQRSSMDEEIIDWVAGLTETSLAGSL